jgi:phosphopantothenoylcysteine decarboxylase / phosphopantothenate---cysteine ligase
MRNQGVKQSRSKTIVMGVCASIAAYRACDAINALRKDNLDVMVCMSKDAHHFITMATLQALSDNPVFQDMFAQRTGHNPVHISLSRRADIILVLPATSDIISKVANGNCDELLACTIACSKVPVVFAPAMNEAMYSNKILQSNISKLKKLGYHFVGPTTGRLICGLTGKGHIADTDEILRHVKALIR